MLTAKIELYADDEKEALYKALKPEISNDVKIDMNDILEITITADTISHFRAKINSYLRLCKAAISCID